MKYHGLRAVSLGARRVLEMLVAGLNEPGAHRRFDSARGAFMPVFVERVGETPLGPVFSVAHYYEQNGDVVPDPDVTFLRDAEGECFPLSYQDGRTFRRAAEVGADGVVRVNRRMQADLVVFVTTWMRNVREQQGLTELDSELNRDPFPVEHPSTDYRAATLRGRIYRAEADADLDPWAFLLCRRVYGFD
jgi:hypothetical protein